MSRHTVSTDKFDICIGIDRPLRHVFAQVLLRNPPEDADTEDAPGFNPFTWMALSEDGVDEAIALVQEYVRKDGEEAFAIPQTMHEALYADVQTYFMGGDVNYAKSYALSA